MQDAWCWIEDAQGRCVGPIGPAPWSVGSAAHVHVAGPAALAPVHAVLTGRPGAVQVEPRGPTWVVRAQAAPERLVGPAALHPGDQLLLGSSRGWLLRVVCTPTPTATPRRVAPRRPLPQGLAAEGLRRLRVWARATGPAQVADRVQRALRTGQLRSPVFLVSLALAVAGWVTASIQGGGRARAEARALVAERQVVACEAAAGGADGARSLDALVAAVLGDRGLEGLQAAPRLAAATQEALGRLLRDPRALLEPAWRPRRSPYAQVVAALVRAGGLSERTASRLAWAAVDPLQAQAAGWRALDAPEEDASACLRGPWGLSYAQGLALGLEVRDEALLPPAEAALLPQLPSHARAATLRAAWDATRVRAGRAAGATITGAPVLVSVPWAAGSGVQERTCVADAGADGRDGPLQVAAALGEALGAEAAGLPPPEAPGADLARIVRLHAARGELPSVDAAAADAPFGATVTGEALRRRAGEHLARLLAVPCAEQLRGLPDPAVGLPGTRVDLEACAALAARASLDRW